MMSCKIKTAGVFLTFFLYANTISAQKATVEKQADGITIYFSAASKSAAKAVRLTVVSNGIIHIVASPVNPMKNDTSLMFVKTNERNTKWSSSQTKDELTLATSLVKAVVSLNSGTVYFTDLKGKILLKEKDDGRVFTPVTIDAGKSIEVTQSFSSAPDDAFYGLGQHQQGLMNYKNNEVELLQNNTEVAIPFLVSNKNYGILWDNYSITQFGDGRKYEALNSLKLFDADNKGGGLTASYVDKRDSSKILIRRIESTIEHDYLPLKNFPESFSLNEGKVIWSGSFQSSYSGLHKFAVRYGGYVKMWIDGKLLLDRWRQSWNPHTALVPVDVQAGKKYSIKIEWDPDGGESYISCNWLRPANAEESGKFLLSSEAGNNINYYFVYGKNMDEIVGGYRQLTGKAPIVPQWALGFWQSRERYKTQNEIISTVKEFRNRQIPLDNIVLDWQYWKPDEWGSQQFDTSRFPDAQGMIDSLHNIYNAHIMISVWPKFYKGIKNYDLMNNEGFLYTKLIEENKKDWLGYVSTFYDAFNPEAGNFFWQLVNKNLYSKGVDAFWMDASEPDMYSNLTIEHRKQLMFPNALGSATKYFNAYPLVNAKVIFEGQQSVDSNKRVFILTRSAYAGSQRYGAAVWSGDIGSRWADMKNQISTGVNFSMSGIPYWTMDIGGFAVEHRFTNPTNEDSKEWKELMTRWYQFGAFCPLFRSHGQFPYREIFNISKPGEPAYESMLYYDKMRYRLLPYIYSMAAKTYWDNYTIMRGLIMDFPADKNVININDEYLFGSSLLINPVSEMNATNRKVYLPKGSGWYDLYSGKYFEGGQTINADAPYSRIPVFVKEGSVIPAGPALQYTSQKQADTITLFVYTGRNTSFTLYEDDDTTYNYEKGMYATIKCNYDENTKTLTIGDRNKSFPGMLQKRIFNIVWIKKDRPVSFDFNENSDEQILYEGKRVSATMK
jgi:alpha-D-xyloside xylohydrolase